MVVTLSIISSLINEAKKNASAIITISKTKVDGNLVKKKNHPELNEWESIRQSP